MLRRPAVAGRFYEGSSEALKQQVSGFLPAQSGKIRARGILAPHAGFVYSGSVAGAVYSLLDLPDNFILIGPNHTGLGAPVALMARGRWQTPLGTVDIDETLAASVLAASALIREDDRAHLLEHSLEVQLPFIQYLKSSPRIVPIQMLDTRLSTCLEVGRAVATAIKAWQEGPGDANPALPNQQSGVKDVLIVASSDMSHYETARTAREKDDKAIRKMLDLDPEGLYDTVKSQGITMCGYGPAVAMLAACKALGAESTRLIKYAHSGEVSGDYDQVVGYAGIIIM